jgi:thiamine-phosphate pyrophosphorylase
MSDLWKPAARIRFALPPVYPITDKNLARRESHLSILKELVRGGAQLVQIRDKSTPMPELLRDLFRCVEFATGNGVTLIVNDRCDLALSCGAMGVHLGQQDLPADAARAILGSKKLIGLSAHSLVQVRDARNLPIHYIGFGPIYPTSTKKDAATEVGLRQLTEACRISAVPVVAIGGIGLDEIREVLRTGAQSAAVISALMKARSIARQMEMFLEAAREK